MSATSATFADWMDLTTAVNARTGQCNPFLALLTGCFIEFQPESWVFMASIWGVNLDPDEGQYLQVFGMESNAHGLISHGGLDNISCIAFSIVTGGTWTNLG